MALHAEDAEETRFDFRETADTYHIARWRQGADKLNHFMRWCESWTRGMTDRQALDAVRRLLPRNLIGDHAFGHWESYLKYRRRRFDHRAKAKHEWQSRYDKTRHQLRQLLSVDPDFQGRFNAVVKARKLEDEPRRMLLGLHDIDSFVRDVLTRAAYAAERQVLLDALQSWCAEGRSSSAPGSRPISCPGS